MKAIEAAFEKFADEDGEISLPRLAEVSQITAQSVFIARCLVVVVDPFVSTSSRCGMPGVDPSWNRSARGGGRANVQRC